MLQLFKSSTRRPFLFFRAPRSYFTTTEAKQMTPEAYEKDWTDVYLNKRNERFNFLESTLTEEEKKEVLGLLSKIIKFSKEEKDYYNFLLQSNPEIHEDSTHYPSNYIKTENTWPKNNKNWHQSNNMQSTLFAFSGAVGQAAISVEGKAEAKQPSAAKEEQSDVKKEKAEYDIKLKSFDAAKKISLIKEIRAMLNLGLKEAKEVVEKAPCDLMKKVKKEQADEISKKLSEFGAVIELV